PFIFSILKKMDGRFVLSRALRHVHAEQELGVGLGLAQPARQQLHRLHRVHVRQRTPHPVWQATIRYSVGGTTIPALTRSSRSSTRIGSLKRSSRAVTRPVGVKGSIRPPSSRKWRIQRSRRGLYSGTTAPVNGSTDARSLPLNPLHTTQL